ncbi:MAG: transcriptional regulator [Candidatus Diapherotrites archaeon]|nr:transcriptional regulator [Candidatus Diapherotrites archaeon]
MHSDFLSLIEEAKALNSSVFSLIRLLLLFSIASVGKDGVTYRELKAALQVSDGALYTNLEYLKKIGYITSRDISFEGKKLTLYQITSEGQRAWKHIRDWLAKLIAYEVEK